MLTPFTFELTAVLIHSHRIPFPWQLLLQGEDIVYEHEPQLSLNHHACPSSMAQIISKLFALQISLYDFVESKQCAKKGSNLILLIKFF